ncbi:MAG: hypothetical protein WAU07_04265 [Microgenomates group bacterium]
MIRTEIKRHPAAYAILLIGLLGFLYAFLGAWPDRFVQQILIVAVGTFYFIWGIATHLSAEHITKRIVGEYLAVALLVCVLLLAVTL